MKKPIKLDKKTTSKIIAYALIVSLLLASITLYGVYNFREREEKPDPIEIIDAPIVYSEITRITFISDIYTYIYRVFSGFIPKATSDRIASLMLDAFSRARIPSEQVLAIGSFIAAGDKATTDFFGKILSYIDFEASEFQGRIVFKEGVKASTLYGEIAMIGQTMLNLLQQANLSATDSARVVYEILNQIPDSKYKQALSEVGRDGFVTLFLSVYQGVELLNSGLDSSYTEAQIRQLQQSFYQVASDYIELYNSIGYEAIETLLGNAYYTIPEDSETYPEEIIEQYNQIIESIYGMTSFSLLVLSEFMVNSDTLTFEYTIKYINAEDEEKEDYMILSSLLIARSFTVALDSAFSNPQNDLFSSRNDLIHRLNIIYLNMETF